MIVRRSAEQFLAELENIISRCRAQASGAGREEAVRQLRKLGFTAGQSLELLRAKKHDISSRS